MSIFQIVFLDSVFLALTDEEKAGEERSTSAGMSENANNQLQKKPGFNKENKKCN